MDAEPLCGNGFIRKETVELEEPFLIPPRGTPVLMEIEIIPSGPGDVCGWEDLTPEEKADFEKFLEEHRGYPLELREPQD